MALPGVKVGPLDPDAAESFGQVSKGNTARKLIRLHSQAHPPQLVRALARPLDPERTKGLLIDEVRGYLATLEDDNGDPVLPKGARVVGAQVRGDRDREQTLTFTYETASGRTAKWFTAFRPEDLPESADKGDELVRVKEMRDAGVVTGPWDAQGTSNEILRRQNAGLARERDALRDALQAGGGAKGVEKAPSDVRPDDQIVADNEQLRRENVEMRERLAQLEAGAQAAAQARLRGEPTGGVASEEPPFEGYDDENARDLIARIKGEDTPKDEVEAVLLYEVAHSNRKSVVGAAEQVLGRSG